MGHTSTLDLLRFKIWLGLAGGLRFSGFGVTTGGTDAAGVPESGWRIVLGRQMYGGFCPDPRRIPWRLVL
jgi:hypothetical protein